MKYLLDTNIISEVAKPEPDYNVICWLQDNASVVVTSSITVEELYYGVMLLPDGKRRRSLREHLDAMVKDLSGRTLVFDAYCGFLCAKLHAKAHRTGYTPSMADLMIAAISQANNCIVATRNIKDFERLGIETVNPFDYNESERS